uniref:Uncharacterized protein n=1 Tax=Triticum urartu TaxID=4572 RepID=A0A8R7PSS3_TRIUA
MLLVLINTQDHSSVLAKLSWLFFPCKLSVLLSCRLLEEVSCPLTTTVQQMLWPVLADC